MAATLLTFAPMIDCECSRFLLTHYRVEYQEAPHVFGWVSVLGVFHGLSVQIPQFYGHGKAVCVGPRAIADQYEPNVPVERRLIPVNGMEAMQVNADWDRFNGILAGSVAVLAYYNLLPFRAIMVEPFSRGVPRVEAWAMRVAYPVFAAAFRSLLNLNAATAADALTQIRILFEETDRRIADGRRYLMGDALTLGDIALASAAAPLLLPTPYAVPIPPFADMPEALRLVITELQARPTGAMVARIYRDHRAAG